MSKLQGSRTTEFKSGFAKRLGLTINGRSISAFSIKSGVSESLLRKYLAADSLPGTDKLVAIARASEVDLEWLATGDGQTPGTATAEPASAAPHEYSVPRGIFTQLGGDAVVSRVNGTQTDSLAFKTSWIKQELRIEPTQVAAMRVSGDSMQPTVSDGDLVLVDTNASVFSDDGIYAIKRQESLVIKRLQRTLNDELIIKCDNPAYDDERLNPVEAGRLGIVGRLIWSGSRI